MVCDCMSDCMAWRGMSDSTAWQGMSDCMVWQPCIVWQRDRVCQTVWCDSVTGYVRLYDDDGDGMSDCMAWQGMSDPPIMPSDYPQGLTIN